MGSPYLLIPISILALGLYFISHFFVRIEILSLSAHRKIWNGILLITFLVTALLGLLLVIEINYKLHWQLFDAILKWHVDFGIAMSFVAVFHFIWHWGYFLKIFQYKPLKVKSKSERIEIPPPQKIYSLILISGFTSIVTQVLLVREITTVFQGNELYITWTIGLWMLLTGAGVFLGKIYHPKNPLKTVARVLLLSGILPVLLVIMLNFTRNIFFLPGTLINPLQFIAATGILLLPVCLLTGFTYSILINLNIDNKNGFVNVYFLEAIGSMIGGLLASFIFIKWFSILQSMLIVLLIIVIFLYFFSRKKQNLVVAGIIILCFIGSFLFPYDSFLKKQLFVNQKVVETTETQYGNLTVCSNAGEYSFFDNGSLLFTSQNIVYSEEYVHYAMLQPNNPEKVLLISGGVTGMLDEILKYPTVEQIDYIELNPEIIAVANKYVPLPENNRINYIIDDGRRYIRNCKSKYDVIIFAVPNPSSFLYSRYFTFEFFSSVKKILAPDGITLIGLSPVGDYLNKEKIQIASSVYNTLKSEFKNVIIISGEKDFFISSDSLLTSGIVELSRTSGIETYYVNEHYLDDFLIAQRQLFIVDNFDKTAKINTDARPLTVFYSTLSFLTHFNVKTIYFFAPIIILLLPLFFFRKVPAAMYTAGFTASSIEMMLIFTFQVFYGYVYSAMGMIIAVFMTGLSIGAILLRKREINASRLFAAQFALIFISLCFLFVWFLHKSLSNQVLLIAVFFGYTLILAIITGYMYVVCTKSIETDLGKSAKTMYGADLIGSAAGAIFATIVLIPLMGLTGSCIIIAGLNGATILLNSFKK